MSHWIDELAGNVDPAPAGPPEDLRAMFTVASEAYERLAAQQRGLHFRIDDVTSRVVVEVHDADGELLYPVPVAQALRIAAGEDLAE